MTTKAALYLRLSKDDGKNQASESIQNQKSFLTQWAAQNQIEIANIFCDDGFSGTSFNRPGFQKLLASIEAGETGTVLTKDLSRLGRDYIMTGYYLEQYFPLKQVRYIAVTDGIDTAKTCGGNDMSPFRAVFNDMYAKDISKKVRAALTAKKQSGKFIGASAPYGYEKDAADKNHLVPDPAAAPVVARIFSLFLSGVPLCQIAKVLTGAEIPTPSLYKGQKNASPAWNAAMIQRILTNPTYIGDLTQNRSQKINYKVTKKTAIPPESWITIPGTHTPLVEKEQFAAAQSLLKRRGGAKTSKTHLLAGLVFCKTCHSPMTFVTQSPKRTYLVCSGWKKNSKACACHSIREDACLQAVTADLNALCGRLLSPSQKAALAAPPPQKAERALSGRLAKSKAALVLLYQDRAAGKITEEEFEILRAALAKERALLTNAAPPPEESGAKEKICGLLTFQNPPRALLCALIDKIEIGPDKEIHICYRFSLPGV